ncbi:tetratricopeptide repeat protein [Kibdelosporangium persicum]|uniref:Tetratricopeptide repeat protein n=1 Tax=Kibdelosporangium persicum TaxID=2698649 RepID=A0ABX2F7D0_9PSEU|nr:tetratricopeptide repeat protein [Kibdelosporangium persicum]NRN67177.1 hypothetical protein [Kibdelosporangium persicum]
MRRIVRGWWLVAGAALITAVLTWLGKIYTGAVVAGAVAAGGAIVAVIAERGRAHIAERANRKPGSLYVSRVNRITDPIRLGVHPAARINGSDQVPPFVRRDRMPELEAALRTGGFVLVVGDSTAGKTRLAFEAMRACLPRHVCVRPADSVALAAGIAAARQKRPSVLWLDDLDEYLAGGGLSRAALRDLGDRVVVLATMRAHLRDEFSSRYDSGRGTTERLTARAAREVFDAITTEIRLERMWSSTELAAARESGDPRIALAVEIADRHGVAETMAAGPALLRDWHDAWSASARPVGRTHADPRGAALVSAAVDVRRAGCHGPVDLDLLRDLHEVYLADRGGTVLRPGTWENAYDWATTPLHATSSLIDPETHQAFDYLVNETSNDPTAPVIPEATWRTLLERLAPDELADIGWRAADAGYAHHVVPAVGRAIDAGSFSAAAALIESLDEAGHPDALPLLERTISLADGQDGVPAEDMVALRHKLAWMIGERIGGHGDPERALDLIRQVAGEAERLLGPDHPQVLGSRLTLARELGACGSAEEALGIATDVVARSTESTGPDDLLTLNARFEQAVWTRHLHGSSAGVTAFGDLLEQVQSIDAVPWSFVADTAWNLGGSLLDSGDAAEAVSVLEQLIALNDEAYGHSHAQTLPYRLTHMRAVGVAGDHSRARELAGELVVDSSRTLGPTHLTTLQAKAFLADWTRACGDEAAAVALYEEVLADGAPLLGDDHWLVTDVRAELPDHG